MAAKVISGTYASGYTLDVADGYTALTITRSGYVEGRGVTLYGPRGSHYSLVNRGRIVGSDSTDYHAVYVTGGSVTNGSTKDTTALIEGWQGVFLNNNANNEGNGAGTVTNFGRIYADTGSGVRIDGYLGKVGGGMITNGSAKDFAVIHGGVGSDGVDFEGSEATLKNFGLINSQYQVSYGTIIAATGAFLASTGTVTNGSASDLGAQFGPRFFGLEIGTAVSAGVMGYHGAITVSNFAFIYGSNGVFLGAGGVLTNHGGRIIANEFYIGGERVATAAANLIDGGRVNNEGLLYGCATNGVILADGGTLINGANDPWAGIFASHSARSGPVCGVRLEGGASTISNFGTISGDYGIDVTGGTFKVINAGSIGGPARVGESARYGGPAQYDGVYVGAESEGGVITNGAPTGRKGLIQGGRYGLDVHAASVTVVNYGIITGSAGVSVRLTGVNDTLVVEAGSTFIGVIQGVGDTLMLADGSGHVSGVVSGTLTLQYGQTSNNLYGFSTLVIGAAASFASQAPIDLEAGGVLDIEGAFIMGGRGHALESNAGLIETTGAGLLTLIGPISNTGTIVSSGGALSIGDAISGTGLVEVDGGTVNLVMSTTQAVTFKSHGLLELGHSQAYAAAITGFSNTPGKTSLDLDDIGFIGASEASFSGTKIGGVLTVSDGVHTAQITLRGDFLSSGFESASDGHDGVLVTVAAPPATFQSSMPPNGFIEAMAGMRAGPSGLSLRLAEPATRVNLLSVPQTQMA